MTRLTVGRWACCAHSPGCGARVWGQGRPRALAQCSRVALSRPRCFSQCNSQIASGCPFPAPALSLACCSSRGARRWLGLPWRRFAGAVCGPWPCLLLAPLPPRPTASGQSPKRWPVSRRQGAPWLPSCVRSWRPLPSRHSQLPRGPPFPVLLPPAGPLRRARLLPLFALLAFVVCPSLRLTRQQAPGDQGSCLLYQPPWVRRLDLARNRCLCIFEHTRLWPWSQVRRTCSDSMAWAESSAPCWGSSGTSRSCGHSVPALWVAAGGAATSWPRSRRACGGHGGPCLLAAWVCDVIPCCPWSGSPLCVSAFLLSFPFPCS